MRTFPPRFAGASLKPGRVGRLPVHRWRISPAFRGGLIEAPQHQTRALAMGVISPAFRGGLIEAHNVRTTMYADVIISPAFRGGLIEAVLSKSIWADARSFPPRFAGASLKRHAVPGCLYVADGHFPRVSRGPH